VWRFNPLRTKIDILVSHWYDDRFGRRKLLIPPPEKARSSETPVLYTIYLTGAGTFIAYESR
jgi:hypothetical protein